MAGATERTFILNTTIQGRRFAAPFFFVLAALLAGSRAARAHDFWIEPSTYTPAVDSSLSVRLYVGERFAGELVPRAASRIERFVLRDARGERAIVGGEGDSEARLPIETAGLHVIGYRSQRSSVVLEPAKFEQYLAAEGLEWVRELRAEIGESSVPGREVYSRCAKALLRAGTPPPAEPDRRLGFTLELLAERSPYALAAGQELPLRLLFEGEPLAGVLIVAVERANPDSALRARSDAAGRVTFRLPRAGVWLIKAVHMVPAPEGLDADWESFWASLTFDLPR